MRAVTLSEPSRLDRFARQRQQKHRIEFLSFVIAMVVVAVVVIGVTTVGKDAPVTGHHSPGQRSLAALPPTTTTTTTTVPPTTTTTTGPTVYLPVTANSPLGCTSGITDGVQWIKYVVKPGDTLLVIAACFGLNGYQEIYLQNSAVIGNDPNLIHPGQVFTITLTNRKMTETASASG